MGERYKSKLLVCFIVVDLIWSLEQSLMLQMGDLRGALSQLEEALQLSQQLKDSSHDADVWGEMADTYADLGDFEKAALVIYLRYALSRAPKLPFSILTQVSSSIMACFSGLHNTYGISFGP